MSSDEEYGELVQRVAALEKAVFSDDIKTPVHSGKFDWSLNERAFVTRYAKNMTGTEKFVLLVAYLAKGEVDTSVTLSSVEKLWSKMTAKSLLGMHFNRKYTSDAKARGWLDGAGQGKYQLTYGWTEIQRSDKSEEEV